MKNNNNTIYKKPNSELFTEQTLPESFINGELSHNKFKFLALLSLFYLFLSFPTIWISFMSGFEPENNFFQVSTKVLNFVSSAIYVYLMLLFKVFLNLRFEFNDADKIINALILITIVMAILGLFMNGSSEELGIVTIMYFGFMVPAGVTTILFGKRLLSIQTYYKYLNLFSWVNIFSGVCLTSVVLFLFALPFGIVSDIAMALMFFSAARELHISKSNKKQTT